MAASSHRSNHLFRFTAFLHALLTRKTLCCMPRGRLYFSTRPQPAGISRSTRMLLKLFGCTLSITNMYLKTSRRFFIYRIGRADGALSECMHIGLGPVFIQFEWACDPRLA